MINGTPTTPLPVMTSKDGVRTVEPKGLLT